MGDVKQQREKDINEEDVSWITTCKYGHGMSGIGVHGGRA